jgi:hypothetical protein
MQHYTIFFIIVAAVHVSGGFYTHHQELKNYTQHLVRARLAAATASVVGLELVPAQLQHTIHLLWCCTVNV